MPATTYYVSDNTTSRGWLLAQTGTAIDPLLGSGGLQRALNLVAAGDTIIVKGGAFATPSVFEQVYLASVTTTNDKSATWLVGDSVRDNSTGLIWQGKILSVAAKVIKIALDVGDYTSIATANGINNTTRTDTDTLSAKATYCFTCLTAGTIAAYITITGGDASYVAGGGFFKINCSPNVSGGLYLGVAYYNIKYMISTGPSDVNLNLTAASYSQVYRCYFGGAVTRCVYSNAVGIRLEECVFATLSAGTNAAAELDSNYQVVLRCKFIAARNIAISFIGQGCIAEENIIHASGRNAIAVTGVSNSVFIKGNIIDGTGATYAGILLTVSAANQIGYRVFDNRITNCATYGIEQSAADQSTREDYNYFQSNSSGDRLNIAVGANSIAGSDTNCGFADSAYATSHDFRLASNASGRRTAIDFDWDLVTSLNKAYITMGLPPTDMIPYFGSKSGGK